ncbi:hypothetical protein NPIL_256611 [Nephila pilipes]|uniref:Uncharacterized protein n=1 Tax=Nephila pilipes TaxID=299642 RepID=A0A8X6QKL5_NEPPI|nr:hypothetical protein NPIL_256611 [Nephila pilipes]
MLFACVIKFRGNLRPSRCFNEDVSSYGARACEEFCDQLEQLIYTYTSQNADSDLDMKLISEMQHIIIRCARKTNSFLFAQLETYLEQIFNNVGNEPTPPITSLKSFLKKVKKNKRNLASPTLYEKEVKNSKHSVTTAHTHNQTLFLNS